MIYLNNAATTKTKPPEVIEAVTDFMKHLNVSPGRGTDSGSVAADSLLTGTRKLLADLFNSEKPENIVFTLNCSDALNTALKGALKKGDHLIVGPIEHNSIVRPARYLESCGIEVSIISDCDRNGIIDPAALPKYIRKNTKMVACLHASNVTGAIEPITEIGAFAKKNGIIFLVDAAQTAGCYEIDVKDMNIDFLAFAGHKSLMGPMGTGGLVIGPRGLGLGSGMLEPLRHGGTGSLSEIETQPEALPDRFETGTPNTPGIAGLKASVEFILEHGVKKIQKHADRLTEHLVAGLNKVPNVTLYGPADIKTHAPVVSFNIKDMEPNAVGDMLEKEYGIIARTGLHCSPLCHKVTGTFPKGTVRFSMGYYNTAEDIETAIKAVEKISLNG